MPHLLQCLIVSFHPAGNVHGLHPAHARKDAPDAALALGTFAWWCGRFCRRMCTITPTVASGGAQLRQKALWRSDAGQRRRAHLGTDALQVLRRMVLVQCNERHGVPQNTCKAAAAGPRGQGYGRRRRACPPPLSLSG
eukprot:TRINITY_DN2510_c0_g1_i1.p1 TRINITY_DN2510_c0_g1~~TRINITY_DN2510_c0_g1_i1.p1  ORF type:complete len:138 (-),score=11.36 TRINITY_DN2510_c0_g1_i1:73-486(-)